MGAIDFLVLVMFSFNGLIVENNKSCDFYQSNDSPQTLNLIGQPSQDTARLQQELQFREAYAKADSVSYYSIGPVIYGNGVKRQLSMVEGYFLPHRLKFIKKISPESFEIIVSALFDYSEPSSRVRCYVPRHGIAFYKGNRIFAFIEICFDCRQIVTTGVQTPIRHLGSGSLDLLKSALKK